MALPGEEKAKRAAILENYRRVFPFLSEDRIDLRGGLEWAKELTARGAS